MPQNLRSISVNRGIDDYGVNTSTTMGIPGGAHWPYITICVEDIW